MTRPGDESSEIKIAALNRKREGAYDLMRPGAGTPWEDRGDSGLIVAFFKTVARVMASPIRLADHIRRPETGGDVNAFVIACGIVLSLAVLTQSAVIFTQARGDPQHVTVDAQMFWEGAGALAAVMWAIWWLLLRVACKSYQFLVTGDSKQKAPPILYQNVLGYSAAPIVLSVIPYLGPIIGGVWVMLVWIVVGRKRLYINPAATVIATVGTAIAMSVVAAAIIFGLMLAFHLVIGQAINVIPPPAVRTP